MRKIVQGHSATTSTTIAPASAGDLRDWLTAQAKANNLHWLLAHTEGGVIWGERRDDGKLHLSCEAFGPKSLMLQWSTLQQARLFGEAGELLLWYGPGGWRARLIHDRTGVAVEWIDKEEHLLWGDHQADGTTVTDGFMQIVEGSQGIVHAPPIGDAAPLRQQPPSPPEMTDRARLLVRHYLGEDDAGVVRIAYSRLMKLAKPGEE